MKDDSANTTGANSAEVPRDDSELTSATDGRSVRTPERLAINMIGVCSVDDEMSACAVSPVVEYSNDGLTWSAAAGLGGH